MIFKRKKRREETNDLTPRQRDILLTGTSTQTGRGFINENELLGAWTEHRANLMRDSGARRPHAYRRFEIDADRPPFINHTQQLLERELFSPLEIAWLEDTCETLSPDQPANLHEVFTSVDGVRSLSLPLGSLEKIHREFGQAAAFHQFRNRPALAEKYKSLGAAIRKVLAEELQTATFEKGVL